MCEKARTTGGYVAMAHDNQEESPMLSLVKLPELKADLNGEDLAKHIIWETISVPPNRDGQVADT